MNPTVRSCVVHVLYSHRNVAWRGLLCKCIRMMVTSQVPGTRQFVWHSVGVSSPRLVDWLVCTALWCYWLYGAYIRYVGCPTDGSCGSLICCVGANENVCLWLHVLALAVSPLRGCLWTTEVSFCTDISCYWKCFNTTTFVVVYRTLMFFSPDTI